MKEIDLVGVGEVTVGRIFVLREKCSVHVHNMCGYVCVVCVWLCMHV